MKSMTIVFLCLLGILPFPSPAGQGPALIPLPREIEWGKGSVHLEGPVAVIGAESHPRTLNAIKEGLQKRGLEIVLSEAQGRATVILGREAAENIRPGLADKLSDLPHEGYVLEVCVENKRPVIILAGAGDAGTWHAAQTLIQMLGQMPRLRPVRIRQPPLLK